jgi:hypothetical protein
MHPASKPPRRNPGARRLLVAAVLVCVPVVVFAAWQTGFRNLGLNRGFDPGQMGTSEALMWRHYYEGRHVALAFEMVSLMRGQMGTSLPVAVMTVWPMARAASAFAGGNADPERDILPLMELAFARLARSTGEDWDPRELAEAELDWWVARRTSGRNSPEEVGAGIARVYTLIYGNDNAHVARAGLLRARAAALRDTGGANADWTAIEALLRESYAELSKGIQTPPP